MSLLRNLLYLAVAIGAVSWFLLRERGTEADPAGPGGVARVAEEPIAVQPQEAPRESASPVPVEGLEGVDLQWVQLNNEATGKLADGELEAAVELFERCHAAQPERDVFRRNLAEALVRLARHEHDVEHELAPAIEHLARAIELVPDREDTDSMRAVLERWKKEAELESNHATDLSLYFELSYDSERADILADSQAVLDHLERAYGDLRDWFGADPVIADGRPKIRVVLYDRSGFDHLTGLGDWAGGVFDGTVRISVEDLAAERSGWERVLRHELVHAFVYEVGGASVPGWLNEGLAQWLEDESSGTAARANNVARARAKLEGQVPFPLERLQGSLAAWDDERAISLAYAESLVIVDAITRHYGEEALRRMVRACGEGRDLAEAFELYAGVPLEFVVTTLRDELSR